MPAAPTPRPSSVGAVTNPTRPSHRPTAGAALATPPSETPPLPAMPRVEPATSTCTRPRPRPRPAVRATGARTRPPRRVTARAAFATRRIRADCGRPRRASPATRMARAVTAWPVGSRRDAPPAIARMVLADRRPLHPVRAATTVVRFRACTPCRATAHAAPATRRTRNARAPIARPVLVATRIERATSRRRASAPAAILSATEARWAADRTAATAPRRLYPLGGDALPPRDHGRAVPPPCARAEVGIAVARTAYQPF